MQSLSHPESSPSLTNPHDNGQRGLMGREKEERLSAAFYSFPSASAFDDFKKSDDWKQVRCKEPFKAKCTDKSNYKQISFKFSSSKLTNQTQNTVLSLRVSIVTTIFSYFFCKLMFRTT